MIASIYLQHLLTLIFNLQSTSHSNEIKWSLELRVYHEFYVPLFFTCPPSSQGYLKSWSKDLGVPIVSVDYSLAPEAPFPRALEECFYAYCWALKNCRLLGQCSGC